MIPVLNLEVYNYNLPPERIAFFPMQEREKSRLLYFNKPGNILQHRFFYDLPDLLPENSLIVRNNTKVLLARLQLHKQTSGKAELLCIEPLSPSADVQIALQTTGKSVWHCMVGGRNVKNNDILLINDKIKILAKIFNKIGQEADVELSWEPDYLTFTEIIEIAGKTPLPPYIKREVIEEDKTRYQTIYANSYGSVAAPTAGLHFSSSIFDNIKKRNIEIAELVLHVGPGTFKPIDTENIAEHIMHSENFSININELYKIKRNIDKKNKIIATGTTTLRTLESLYWHGAKLCLGDSETQFDNKINISQWESYHIICSSAVPGLSKIIGEVIKWAESHKLENIQGGTQILLVPGYEFRMVDGLITNFHLPKSTLILLVAAFIGKESWRMVYNSALENQYRFLSYGDSSLLLAK